MQVIAFFIVLGQFVHMLPQQVKARYLLWIFFLVLVAPYLANTVWIEITRHSLANSFTEVQKHPVELLVQDANTKFENLLSKQSQNYTAAYSEYQRRYGIDPPPGFEAWYEFAASKYSLVIDDFDTLYESVSPFWKISGQEVVEAMSAAKAANATELWACALTGKTAETQCSHHNRSFDRHFASTFDRLLGALRERLPDVNFLLNHLDEPRALGYASLPYLRTDKYFTSGPLVKFTSTAKRYSWNALTKPCGLQQNKTAVGAEEALATYGIPFVTSTISALDLCRHPEYRTMHGLLMEPTPFNLIEGLVPVLTTGTLSTMSDILYPSPAYLEAEFEYDEAHDIHWEHKANNLYWAGSTTGGYASDAAWQHYQRQRFVALAQNLERNAYSYLREKGGIIRRVKSSFWNNKLFDVTYTRVFQCERTHCNKQKAYFNVRPWAHKDKIYRSRLVFDIDGNGISGRYYMLLASRSVPLKQTLLREWHDDRLVPWFHYIPVSQGMEELPELVSFLTLTKVGQQIAQEIAEHGRIWFSQAFREADFSIYIYRLLLELARLQDPERLAI